MRPQWLFHVIWSSSLIIYHLLNPLRFEHLLMLGGVLVGWHLWRVSREFILVFLPLIIYGLLYDLLRIFNELAHRRVAVGEVREFELALLGWKDEGVRRGPVELLQEMHVIWLDLIGGVWYASHVGTIILFGVYLWWTQRKNDTTESLKTHKQQYVHCFLWGFLGVNLLGFAIQIAYPVAPPWYVELYGYAHPTTLVTGDPAGLARIDTWLGISYFQDVYSKAAYVFGAVPSLHVVYPMWLALFTRRWWSRTLAWFYTVMMGFFAVYFTHHYVVDLIAGVALALGWYYMFMRTRLQEIPPRIYHWLHQAFIQR